MDALRFDGSRLSMRQIRQPSGAAISSEVTAEARYRKWNVLDPALFRQLDAVAHGTERSGRAIG
ncbi:MAG: hypothetical protein AAF355_05195 [Myxococcota bacterium]